MRGPWIGVVAVLALIFNVSAFAGERELNWDEITYVQRALKIGNKYFPSREWSDLSKLLVQGRIRVESEKRLEGANMLTRGWGQRRIALFSIDLGSHVSRWLLAKKVERLTRPNPRQLRILEMLEGELISFASQLLHELQHVEEELEIRRWATSRYFEIQAYGRELDFHMAVLKRVPQESQLWKDVASEFCGIRNDRLLPLGVDVTVPKVLEEACGESE